jgi:predicted RNA methylase
MQLSDAILRTRNAFERFVHLIRRDGFLSAANKAIEAASRKPSPSDAFDEKFGVDTSAAVPLWKLKIPSRHARAGSNYQTISADNIERVLGKVPSRLPLIDLGCGKGRVLIIAHRLGFHPVTGVEFSPELAEIALQNLSTCGIPGRVLCCDAADVDFPSDCVIFMYNPFDSHVMEEVARKIRESTSRIYVVYVNAKYADLFEDFQSIYQEPGIKIWANRPNGPLATSMNLP